MGLLPVIYTVHGTLYSWLSTTFGLYLVLGIWFNHSMGMSIKPGFLRDYYLPEETSEEKEIRIHDIKRHKNIEPFGEDMKILMEFAHSDMDSILNYSEMRCNRCEWFKKEEKLNEIAKQPIKPLRFHHCSICGDCIMNMDHHCPWFNNCVGIYNCRYFLLFLLHLWLSCIFMLYFIYICNGHPFYYRYGRLINLAIGLHIGLFFGMGFFCGWHWYLCLIGVPQLEYIQTRMRKSSNQDKITKKLEFKCWRDNLYFIFGTQSLFSMLLPSIRSLPMNGLEYTLARLSKKKQD